MIGKVKFWDSRKGFGFIEADHTDYYVRFKELSDDFICSNERKNLDIGETVKFEARNGERGPYAVKVTIKC